MASHRRSDSLIKPHHLDIPLSDLPSALDPALNSPKTEQYKTEENGLLQPEAIRRLSTSTIDGLSNDGRSARSHSQASYRRNFSPPPPNTWRASAERFWQRNRGLWLVALSQLFGALMNVTTRLLELEGDGMDPFQILFARMGITMVLCCFYMWYTSIPYFPFGQRGVRSLLVARGMTGFFGIFGMYYSLQYLPIADCTVITFLAPGVASLICWVLLGEKFTRVEQVGTIVSLLGVVLIARPTSFFHMSEPAAETAAAVAAAASNSTGIADHDFHHPDPNPGQRISAIGVALLGVLGSAGAFTTIRWIGKRAHPLISVNYFATWCTIVSTVVLTARSSVSADSPIYGEFKLPSSFRQWAMLFALGTCGFIMQFMLTAGLSHEKGNRANNMVYTQMLFALLFDRFFFGTVPGGWSLVGSAMILGSAVYIAVQKANAVQEEPKAINDEEVGMLQDMDDESGRQNRDVDRAMRR